ncbi:MAG: serine/threonine-protein kinase [Gemmatimonadaceae bacterium]
MNAPSPPDPTPARPPDDTGWHPDTIGHYRITGVLGRGGMGTVYEAEQEQPLRMVALKVIRPEYASPEMLRRFARESDLLGRLQHPGIAQIYEAGTSEGAYGEQPFFAMELIRGQQLTDYANSKSLDLNGRLELFGRVCDSVHYAHQQGIIHRDLKPANILVDVTGQPKVLDFGVARLTDADVKATRQTSVGEVVGTLQYMSPEQVGADPDDIDIRSDVYSLGVILYELLSGQLPYDLTRKLIFEAARVILVDDPARLSLINRNLKGDIEVIVAKALEKEKRRRYGSAEELASDVRRFLSDEPITARPASAIYQLRKFARRNRALVGGLGLAGFILLVGAAVSLWQAVRATTAERLAESRRGDAVAAGGLAERRRAQADSALLVADSARADAFRQQAAATASAQRATGEAAKAQAVNAFLQNMLASSDPAKALGKELSVREVLDQAASRVGTGELQRQPEVRAGVETTIGRTYFALGLYDKARPHLDSAYSIHRRAMGSTSLAVGESAADLGELARASGHYDLAEKRVTEALALKRATLRPDDDQVTATLVTLADVRYLQARNAEAEQLYRQALSLTRARHGNAALQVAERLRSFGNFLTFTDRPKEARPLLEESLAILRKTYGETHPQIVEALVALSDARVNESDLVGAEKNLRAALPIARTLYGQEHPVIANVVSRLGAALRSQRKLEVAEPLLREGLAMRVKLLGEEHPDVQLARVELARLFQAQGKYGDADTMLTAVLRARRAALGEMSPALAATLNDLGQVADAREDWPAAEQRYRAALPIWRAAHIEDGEINSMAMLGWTLSKQEKYDEAEPLLTDVLARRRARYGDNHWSVGDSYEKLAGIAFGRGQLVRGESLSRAGLAVRRTLYGARAPQVASQLLNIAFFREQQNDTSGAIPLVRESLSISQETRPATDLNVITAQRLLAVDLCATGAAAEGDSVIRAAIAHSPADSTQAMTHRLRSTLGFCLTRQRRFAEAETLLLQAESGLLALRPTTAKQSAVVITWLVNLYERWGKAAEAAEWRGRRDAKN